MERRFRHDLAGGRIEVITGGMFSGKSEELLRRLRRTLIARQTLQVFKPRIDDRHGPDKVVTRDRREVDAQAVGSSAELESLLVPNVEVVGIDEAQFFDDGLVDLVTRLADRGVRIVIAGLDQDYRRLPFGPMPQLMALAEHVDKVHAVCVQCGATAHYSQRFAGGGEQVQVGDGEAYEARCRSCYEPYRPE